MSWMEFKQHIWPLKDRLYRLALRLVNDRAEAEDVVQEVMIKLWRQGTDLAVIRNLEAWCLKLTKNQALDKLKGGYRKRKTNLTLVSDHQSPSPNPAQQAETSDTLSHVHALLQQLPEQHRATLQLRDIEGLSYQEISEALDMTLPQVKTNLFRARKALREQLLRYEK
ncbi:MAG: RNA polymerase sigma factor [Bacteroidota bacterium]